MIPELAADLIVPHAPPVVISNPYLELIPPDLISGIVTDRGVLAPSAVRGVLGTHPTSPYGTALPAEAAAGR